MAGPASRRREPSPPGNTPGPASATVRDALAYDRTHLANERTFAAWLRTGISVAAGGVAVAHIVPEPARDSGVALLLGVAFVVFGVGLIAYGARQFAHVAAALARGSGRGSPVRPRTIDGLTAAIGLLLIAVLLFLWSHRGTVRATVARTTATYTSSPTRSHLRSPACRIAAASLPPRPATCTSATRVRS